MKIRIFGAGDISKTGVDISSVGDPGQLINNIADLNRTFLGFKGKVQGSFRVTKVVIGPTEVTEGRLGLAGSP